MSTAAIVGGTIAAGVGGSVISGVMGANAAQSAANTQANAADQAAQLQYQSGQNALAFQQGVYGNQISAAAPYIATGQAADVNLANLLGLPITGTYNPNLTVPPITAPTSQPTTSQLAGQPTTLQSLGTPGIRLADYQAAGGQAGTDSQDRSAR